MEGLWIADNVRRLIELVRGNPGLYAKGQRSYKDKAAKDLAWETIGANLLIPCTGKFKKKYLLFPGRFYFDN